MAADPDWQIVGGDPASCNRCNRTAAPTLVLGPAFGRRSLALNALALSPQFAIISVGANNRSANPSDDTLTRLRDSGAAIYRTDEHGTIHLTTDGEQVWIETEK